MKENGQLIFQIIKIDQEIAESKLLTDEEYNNLHYSIFKPLEDVFYQLKSHGYIPYIHGFLAYDLIHFSRDRHLRNEIIVYIQGPSVNLFGEPFDIKRVLNLSDKDLFKIRLLRAGNGIYSLIYSFRENFKPKIIFIYGDINKHLKISHDKKYGSILMDCSEQIFKNSNSSPIIILDEILLTNNYWMFKDFIKYLMKYDIELAWEIILSDKNKIKIANFLHKLPNESQRDFIKYVIIHLNYNHKKLFEFIFGEFLFKIKIEYNMYTRIYNKMIKVMRKLYSDYPRRMALVYYHVLLNRRLKNEINDNRLVIFNFSYYILHRGEYEKMRKYFIRLIERGSE